MHESNKQECMEQAEECVESVLEELGDRSGFDGFWDLIDEETQSEIKKSLQNIVYDYLICSDAE